MSVKGAENRSEMSSVIENLMEGKTPEGWIEVSGMPEAFDSDLERIFIDEGEGDALACLQIKPLVAAVRSIMSQIEDIIEITGNDVADNIADSIECIGDGLDCIEAVCLHTMEDPHGYGDDGGDAQ